VATAQKHALTAFQKHSARVSRVVTRSGVRAHSQHRTNGGQTGPTGLVRLLIYADGCIFRDGIPLTPAQQDPKIPLRMTLVWLWIYRWLKGVDMKLGTAEQKSTDAEPMFDHGKRTLSRCLTSGVLGLIRFLLHPVSQSFTLRLEFIDCQYAAVL